MKEHDASLLANKVKFGNSLNIGKVAILENLIGENCFCFSFCAALGFLNVSLFLLKLSC